MRKTRISTPLLRRALFFVAEHEREHVDGLNGGPVPGYAGMVFNFDPPVISPRMTMVATPMSLQLAFVGPDRIVRSVHDAPAFSGVYTHAAPEPIRWVIETYDPWKLLRVGDRVDFSSP